MGTLTREFVELEIDGVALRIAVLRRSGSRPPLFCLHGFGSTKEDYADLACDPQFAGRALLAYDAPGCGESDCDDLSALSVPFLRRTAEMVLQHYGVTRYHLLGHSMGGLTALLLAQAAGDAVLSFSNIEGNVAPEDCFLSRQILEHPVEDPQAFLSDFALRAWNSPDFSHPLFAAGLAHKVRAEAVAPIFRSMVALSDGDELMTIFTGLACPRMFVYGASNRGLSYLGRLLRNGVQLAEIPRSGHWPMYANPTALWDRLTAFVAQSEPELNES